jgi:hypothetical protein
VRTLAIVVLVGVGLWLWTNHARSVTERELATVASSLAGRHVGVHCQGFWAAMLDIGNREGEVDFPADGTPPDHMFLTRDTCKRLRNFDAHKLDCLTAIDWTQWSIERDYNAPCERRTRRNVQAINTLTHEAMHLRGTINEAAAQCAALQHDASTVIQFGGTQAEGQAAAKYMLALMPLLPSEYQSVCRL